MERCLGWVEAGWYDPLHLSLFSCLNIFCTLSGHGVNTSLRWGVRTALLLSETDDLSSLFGERLGPTGADLDSDEALNNWLMREAVTYSHICGTCKMGPASDPMAVVGQEGRVYGLDGLRVVDASIMPNLVRAPINPTVLAIGERISDLMRRENI